MTSEVHDLVYNPFENKDYKDLTAYNEKNYNTNRGYHYMLISVIFLLILLILLIILYRKLCYVFYHI